MRDPKSLEESERVLEIGPGVSRLITTSGGSDNVVVGDRIGAYEYRGSDGKRKKGQERKREREKQRQKDGKRNDPSFESPKRDDATRRRDFDRVFQRFPRAAWKERWRDYAL